MALTFFGKRGDNMPYFDRIPPKATRARLIEMLNQEQRYSNMIEITSKQRVGDLLEANNRYLERARASEQSLRECEAAIDKLKDELAELRGEKDALVIQNLEETTWLRMAKNSAIQDRDTWINEAKSWAKLYVELRQQTELGAFQVNKWVKNLQTFAITGMAIDAILCFGALLIIMGALPPMFPELPWWWK
jgi:ribosomal protein L29